MTAITTHIVQQGPSFPSAFWVTGVLLRVVITAAFFALTLFQPISVPLLAAALATDLMSFIWAVVRFNTAAGNHLNETGRFWPVAGGYGFFFLAFLVMLFTWWMIFSDSDMAHRQDDRTQSSLNTARPPVDRFIADYSRDQRQLVFRGVVAQGAADGIAELLDDSDTVDTLVLNSPGGNVYEARDMAREVQDRGLNTHVTNECSSSCLLVFMAGQSRSMGPGANLGFHRYGLDFIQVLPQANPLREMRNDQQFYLERGVDLDFLDEVFDLNRQAIWYPRREELDAAGILNR